MKCPVCPSAELRMTERQGVEIDYCPECRGVWLDRGELDKIIEKSNFQPVAVMSTHHDAGQQDRTLRYPDNNRHDDHDYRHNGHHKKKSWLTELFD